MARFTVRAARDSDNQALVELDRRCTMGEETTLAFDRSPDFFARSKPYERPQLFVAEAGRNVVGVGGVALKSLRVAGQSLKAAYFYDLRVDPDFRRLGVASTIGDALREVVKQEEVDFTYSLVLEGNIPSLELVAKRGSRPVRRCALAILPGCEAGEVVRWRPLQEQDLERVALLFESTFSEHDLFPPSAAAALEGLLERAPGLSLKHCRGLHVGGNLSACFGLWDYSPILRMRVQRKSARGQVWLPQAEGIAPHFLLPLAFREPALLGEVIQEARRILGGRRQGAIVPALLIPYDPEDRTFAALKRIERFEVGVQLFARPIRREVKLGDRPLNLDPTDL